MTKAGGEYTSRSETAPVDPALYTKNRRHSRRFSRRSAGSEGAQDEIDRLLTFLDESQPDADLEPTLGSVAAWETTSQHYWADGGAADREDEHDGREPSLCGLTVEITYTDRDLELDEDREPREHRPRPTRPCGKVVLA